MEKIKTKAYALWNALVTHPGAMTNRKIKEGRDWWGSQFKGTVLSGDGSVRNGSMLNALA